MLGNRALDKPKVNQQIKKSGRNLALEIIFNLMMVKEFNVKKINYSRHLLRLTYATLFGKKPAGLMDQ